MTKHLHESTQQLIREIERKDRRFRIAQSIFMTLLILGFIAGGYFAARAFNDEQRRREQDNAAVIAAINQKLDDQSKQLRCIVEFFTIEDRENASIRSVEDCFRVDRSSLGPEGEQRPNFTPGPSGPPLVINPRDPGPGLEPGPSGGQPDPEPAPEPEQPTERPPREVLGIPVCVPLTGLCLR